MLLIYFLLGTVNLMKSKLDLKYILTGSISIVFFSLKIAVNFQFSFMDKIIRL